MRLLPVFFFLFLVLALGLFSCNPMPNDGIPFYMSMDSVIFTPLANQGGNSQSFTDVWVTSGPNNLGAFQLPINFPVLESGYVSFVVAGGVMEDGDPTTRVIYPMITVDTFSISNAIPGQKYSHRPQYSYLPGVSFPFPPENFGVGSDYDNNMKKANMVDSLITVGRNDEVGYINTNATVADSGVTTNQTLAPYAITAGDETWLEIDYKCQVPFFVGFNAYFNGTTYPSQVQVLFVNVTPSWTKLYISFTSLIGSTQADAYTLYFQADRPLGTNGGNVYLNNIKLITIPG